MDAHAVGKSWCLKRQGGFEVILGLLRNFAAQELRDNVVVLQMAFSPIWSKQQQKELYNVFEEILVEAERQVTDNLRGHKGNDNHWMALL